MEKVQENDSGSETSRKLEIGRRESFGLHNENDLLRWSSTPAEQKRANTRAFIKNKKMRKKTLSFFSWIEVAVLTLSALGIQFIFGRNAFFPDGRPACKSGIGEPGRNINMCGLHKAAEDNYTMIRFLVAFIIGGFVKKAVAEWREKRSQYASLCGAVRQTAVTISSRLPLTSEPKDMQVRQLMGRWIILAFELGVLKAKGEMNTAEGRAYLERTNLLKDGEWEAMCQTSRNTSVSYWILMKAVKLRNEGVLSEDDLTCIHHEVANLRGKNQDLLESIFRDLPLPYVIVTACLVNFFLVVYTSYKGVQWAVLYYDTGVGIWTNPRWYFEVLLLTAFNALLAFLFDISNVLHNPFLNRKGIDIPHAVSSNNLRQYVKYCFKGALPKSMDNENDSLSPGDSFLLDVDVEVSNDSTFECRPKLMRWDVSKLINN